MRRAPLTALFFAVACCTAQGTAIDRYSIRDAERRNVVVMSEDGSRSCSGFIVQTGLVATARHCAGANITVNLVPARIVASSDSDILVLSVQTRDVPPIVISTDVQAGDEVFSVVSHAPWPELVSVGRVVAVSGSAILCSVLAAPGISGGALYNAHGSLVGVLNKIISTEYGPDGKFQAMLFASAVPARELLKIMPRPPMADASRRIP